MKDSRFPTSHEGARILLADRPSIPLMFKTVLVQLDGCIGVVHHSTIVVRFFPDGSITLDTKRHLTRTTKDRLNKCLPEGYTVFQKKHEWYLDTPEGTLDFFDGITLRGLGRFLEAGGSDPLGSPSTQEVN